MTPHWTLDLCIWHYTGWRNVGLVISWHHSVNGQIHRSQGQHEAILYNVRYTDHMSNMDPFCIMSDTQITSPTSFCIMSDAQITSPSVSDIIQNDGMLDLWSVYLTLYRMMMDSWSVYLPLYRMTTCWTRDLCIWHYTEWRHVGLVISCCHSV